MDSMYHPTDPRTALAKAFDHFAASECTTEPFYEALCRLCARTPWLLELLDAASPTQRRPNLLLAAVHYLLLRGMAHGVAAYYPSVGGSRPADGELEQQFLDFCERQRSELLALIATRTTQTNEVGRCAVAWPVLQWLSQRIGRTRIAWLDFGCSAGLNLGLDHYAYDYGRFELLPSGVSTVRMACRIDGQSEPARDFSGPQIVERLGIDPQPAALDNVEALNWLRACLWPSDKPRRERFDAAVQIAQRECWSVREVPDCSLAVEAWLDALPSDLQPVLFNSWVMTYLDPSARADHVRRMLSLVRSRGLAWISAESPALSINDAVAPLLSADADADADHRAGSLWTVVHRGDSGEVETQVVARSHAHGHWMEWFGDLPLQK